jgi:trehalose-6-phosphate synthase
LTDQELKSLLLPPYLRPINLSHSEVADYYDHFANGILWPLAHGLPQATKFSKTSWDTTQSVATRFADAIVAIVQPTDIIWVHDYHLISLPSLLRARGLKNRIGFFLHVPFFTPNVAASLPHGRQLITQLLDVNLLGLQTERDVQCFQDTLKTFNLSPPGSFNVGAFPIGIDFDEFNAMAKQHDTQQMARNYKRTIGDKTIIFSLSRLDYTKGILTQLEAYERFITSTPFPQQYVYRLNVAPSREQALEYRNLKKDIEQRVAIINKRYGTLVWQPIIYSYKNQNLQEVCAWYQIADIHVNTPVADGMNLIAKEYVAARQSPGVLIISSTMGAAAQLTEALIVPPDNPAAIVNALHKAVAMSNGERAARWSALRHHVQDTQAANWANDFLGRLKIRYPV